MVAGPTRPVAPPSAWARACPGRRGLQLSSLAFGARRKRRFCSRVTALRSYRANVRRQLPPQQKPMRMLSFIAALLLASAPAVNAGRVDLTTIDRTIAKEPAYQSKTPKYGLLV